MPETATDLSFAPSPTVPGLKDVAAQVTGPTPAQILAEAPKPPSQEALEAARQAAREARAEPIRRQENFAAAQDKEYERVKIESEAYSAQALSGLPTKPQIQAPPSRGLRPFLATSDTEPTENAISKFMQALSLMATMVGGGRAGARASLSAMTGALEGWREGDKDRADRAYADWKAKTDALLEQSNLEIKYYELAMGAKKIPLEQRMRLMELAARGNDNHLLADKFKVEDAAATAAEVERLADAHRDLQKWVATIDAQKAVADRQARDARDRINVAREHNEILRSGQVQKSAERQEKIDERKLEPAHGEFYDWRSGRIRQITKQEQMDNTLLQQRGEMPEFTFLTPAQVQLVERLAIAPKIIDRLDTIITKITAAAPGQNITQGMVNRLAMKAGLAPDLQEFRSLNVDQALELTAALSGGQPRMTILQILRGEATPDFAMTTETAHRAIDVARTTIRNRLTQTTGDPKAMEKLSEKLAPYEPRKPAAGVGGKVRVTGPKGPDGKPQTGMADAGQDLPPGWSYTP